MDYWEHLDVRTYIDYNDFLEKNPGAKIYMATTKAPKVYTEVNYEPDCYIMFGKESAGIPEEILVEHKEAIAALRAKNITCLAAALYQSQPLSAARPGYPGGVCVVIGSEGQGLTEETIAACSGTVRIPMTDRVESLNAGIAGSILLWHFREESL